jgi:hypothetical protein
MTNGRSSSVTTHADDEKRPTLDQFADIIGEEAAVRLSVRYGGRRLYVPIDPPPGGDLAQLIGVKAAYLLARRFGGVSFEMPLERGKRERIIHLSNRGKTVREIAEIVGCTERHVKYVRAEHRVHGGDGFDLPPKRDPSQVDLFSVEDAGSPAPGASPTSED